MKYVWGALGVLFALVAAATIRPDWLGLSDWMLTTPLAQIMAARAWLAGLCLAVAVLLALLGVVRKFVARAGRISLSLALAFLLIGLGHIGILLAHGIQNPAQLGADSEEAITVLTYNTQGGNTNAEELAAIIESEGVDVAVLPETGTRRAEEIQETLETNGLGFELFDTGTGRYEAEFGSTVVLVAQHLGRYVQDESPYQHTSAVVLEPAAGQGPRIVGIHTFSPQPKVIEQWRAGIEEVYGSCSQPGPFIIAGDFNSTNDHQHAVGATCADGAIQAGSGAVGTWPSSVPALAGTAIDRVLHDGGTYQGVDAKAVQVGESDHRGLIVRLMPKGE